MVFKRVKTLTRINLSLNIKLIKVNKLNKIEVLELNFPSFLIKIIQQKSKMPTVICSTKISNHSICITTHVEGIIKEIIYEYWCPISKKFYKHSEKSLGNFYFKILKLTFIKSLRLWAPSFNKIFWINHYPIGAGLAIYEDIFQKVCLSKDSCNTNFITIDHSEIADYYEVKTEEIERLIQHIT